MKKLLYILPLAAAVVLTSCGKDDDSAPAQNRSALLSAKTWKMTNQESQVAGQSQSTWSTVDACDKDNTYKFNSDGTFLLSDAGEVCSFDRTMDGTWSLNSNQSVLTVMSDGDTLISENIESMTATQFKVSSTETFNNVQFKEITTFTAQ